MISFDEFNKLNENDLLDYLSELFENDEFLEIENITSMIEFSNKSLFKNLSILYLILLSMVKLGKIEKALSIMRESGIVSDNADYFEEDGANFTNLLKEDEETQKAVIVSLFIKRCITVDDKYQDMGINYFELISSLYELGYSDRVIKDLNNKGYKIFNI